MNKLLNTTQSCLAEEEKVTVGENQKTRLEKVTAIPQEENTEEFVAIEESHEEVTVRNTMDVTNMIRAIRSLDTQIELYHRQEEESKWFYRNGIEKAEARIEQIKMSIRGFFHQQGFRNLRTPIGTAYLKTLTVKHWGEDDSLVTWALAHAPNALRIAYQPDKRALTAHIQKTGEIPPEYGETVEERLCIK